MKKLTIPADKVVYNPKTDEYTVEVPIDQFGTLWGHMLYVDGQVTLEDRKKMMDWILNG